MTWCIYGKLAFLYTKLKLSGDHLYNTRNKSRPKAQKIDLHKSYLEKRLPSESVPPLILKEW